MSRSTGCANLAICFAGQGQAVARENLPPGRRLATGAEALNAVADKLAVMPCMLAAGLHPSDRLGSESEPEISN